MRNHRASRAKAMAHGGVRLLWWAEVALLRFVRTPIPALPGPGTQAEQRLADTLVRAYQRVGDVLEGRVDPKAAPSILRAAELVMESIVGPITREAATPDTHVKVEILNAIDSGTRVASAVKMLEGCSGGAAGTWGADPPPGDGAMVEWGDGAGGPADPPKHFSVDPAPATSKSSISSMTVEIPKTSTNANTVKGLAAGEKPTMRRGYKRNAPVDEAVLKARLEEKRKAREADRLKRSEYMKAWWARKKNLPTDEIP